MAIASPAHFADNCCEPARTRQRLSGPASFILKLPTFSVIFCALAVVGLLAAALWISQRREWSCEELENWLDDSEKRTCFLFECCRHA